MIGKTNKNAVVSQANRLVEARYNLTLTEQRLILVLVSMINPKDVDFREYELRVEDFGNLIGVNRHNLYEDIKELLVRLRTRAMVIKTDEGNELVTGWIVNAEYSSKEGTIRIMLDPKLRPFLLQLKREFTRYKLGVALVFRSQYSIRVYQLLKQYESLKERRIAIDDLRSMLGLEMEYPAYGDFKRRVLVTAQKEINNKTDLSFTFQEIKQGRKVVEIRFQIEKQTKPAPEVQRVPKLKPRTAEEKATAKGAARQMRDILKGKTAAV